jgi:hypothetical protein
MRYLIAIDVAFFALFVAGWLALTPPSCPPSGCAEVGGYLDGTMQGGGGVVLTPAPSHPGT